MLYRCEYIVVDSKEYLAIRLSMEIELSIVSRWMEKISYL